MLDVLSSLCVRWGNLVSETGSWLCHLPTSDWTNPCRSIVSSIEAHSHTSDIAERKLFSLFVKHIEFACKSPAMKSKAAAAQ